MALLTDDRINAYVADKHREALQLGKDAAQQKKKDAASAEMTPSKAMTEATDDDSDSEEPKIFHPSKKQLNEKGKDSGVEKNNATLGKEKSTLQGIEETLLGDGDSDSDDRDFATHLGGCRLAKRKRRLQNNAAVQVFELLPTTRSRRDYFATTSISRQQRRIQREVEVVVRKIPTNWTISKATMSNDLLFKRKNS